VPAFIDYLRANQVARDSVLAVIINSGPEPVSYQEDIAEVAPVCVEPLDGELAAAFKVRGFPAFCVLDGAGSVSTFSHEPAVLPALTATRQR
jgi:thioredoxin-related protein